MLDHEIEKAKDLYDRWFATHPDVTRPGVKNPTDINTERKFRFAMDIGWEDFSLMQRARKKGFDFTKPKECEPA